jgi:AraC-like DNA-binding protein
LELNPSRLNVTPNYLSDIIKYHSGESALTIIHNYIIEEAKKMLATTNLSVSEISYKLGFEYPNLDKPEPNRGI